MKRLATLLLGAVLTISANAAIIPPGGGGLAWLTVSNLSYNIAVNIAGTGGISSATATNIANAAAANSITNTFYATASSILPDGTDQTVKINNLMSNVNLRGGGEIVFPAGQILINGQLVFPTNVVAGPPKMNPIHWRGVSGFQNGSGIGDTKGTVFNMPFTNGSCKIFAGAFGKVDISGITFYSPGGQITPFFLHTFTTLHMSDCAFIGALNGVNARQDAIVSGGLAPADFTSYSTNSTAQGYGTVIERCYFDNIRTLWTANNSANSYVFRDSYNSVGCGGNASAVIISTNGATIVGVTVSGNTFEATGYTNMIFVNGASLGYFFNNSFYDPSTTCTLYHFTNGAVANRIEDTFHDSSFRSYNNITGQTFLTSSSGQTNRINNYSQHDATAIFVASVPAAYFASDGSYIYPEISSDRVTWRWVSSDGTQNREIVRTSNTGELGATNFTMYGSSSNNSPVAALGVNAGGNFTRMAIGSGSGTPGGSSLQVQYNTNSTFAGDAGLTYDPVTDQLTSGSLLLTGSTTDGHIAFTNLTGFWTAFAPTNAARSHTNVWETWPVEPTQVFVPVGTNGGRVHWKGTALKVSLAGAVTGATSVESGIFTQDTGTGTFQLGGGSVNLVSVTKALSVGHAITSVAGVGGALTNFTLVAGAGASAEEIYIDAGTTNVNIVAIMGYASDAVHYINVTATNRTGTPRILSLDATTNAFVSLQQFDGITAPFTVTNSQALNLYLRVGPGTNVQYAAKPSALPAP